MLYRPYRQACFSVGSCLPRYILTTWSTWWTKGCNVHSLYYQKQTYITQHTVFQINLISVMRDLTKALSKTLLLTMHGKDIAGLIPMAWRLSLSTLDEGWQTGSPLVPYKLPRLLPHKGRMPGRSRDSPSWTELLTVQQWATRRGGGREKEGTPFPGSACPFLEFGCCGSPMQTWITPVCCCLSCINGAWVLQGAFQSNLAGKSIKKLF